ncbi:fatty acid desaturase [Sphingobacterium cellulitidis]|uniref:fatty acid desaturase family protein n=1 Tax=Sphingobacterium cellulitidis TaxID=1768011 RepID=UPI000B9412BF|nr:acyl-CoA desaturase [Sphingobacterium cellulitidis]OYD46857.1 fatty acid desaturase [Sphingobacterium cellulitidis]
MRSTVKFNNINSLFSKTLKQNINDYFQSTIQKKTGNRKLFIKASILLLSFITLYTLLVFIQPHWSISIILCILFGVNFAAIGFNIMHDAGHNSFSENKKVNSIMSYSLNLLGGNIFFWKLKHNIAHHTYTNIDGEDPDIEVNFMRLHHEQKLKKHHKYQHLYFIFLYGLSYLAWIFYQDYEKYFKQKKSGLRNKFDFEFPLKEKLIFWISKILHAFIFIVVPILMVGWIKTIVGILIVGAVCGICLAIVFQLAHVVEETEFKSSNLDKIEEEWMIHQIQSTANFSTNNRFLTWLLGGLNFQVEHHLFPKISHIHYPEINKIVRETCQKYNIKYNEFGTFWMAFSSHVKVIKQMSVA